MPYYCGYCNVETRDYGLGLCLDCLHNLKNIEDEMYQDKNDGLLKKYKCAECKDTGIYYRDFACSVCYIEPPEEDIKPPEEDDEFLQMDESQMKEYIKMKRETDEFLQMDVSEMKKYIKQKSKLSKKLLKEKLLKEKLLKENLLKENNSGIIYLIQPCELVETKRYKVGMSKNTSLDRVKNGYKKGSRYLCIMEVKNPIQVEKNIIKVFNETYKNIAGKEYYQIDVEEKEMIKLFINIVTS